MADESTRKEACSWNWPALASDQNLHNVQRLYCISITTYSAVKQSQVRSKGVSVCMLLLFHFIIMAPDSSVMFSLSKNRSSKSG